MTLQEIFNKSVTGIIAQGRPSTTVEGTCAYRGMDGAKCAAGHLLPDSVVRPDLNGYALDTTDKKRLRVHKMFIEAGIDVQNCDVFLLVSKLQNAHDGHSCDGPDFVREFTKVALAIGREFGLDVSVVRRIPQVRRGRKLAD